MKDLLPDGDAIIDTRTGGREGKQQVVVCIVDVHGSSRGELVRVAIELESRSYFYKACEIHRGAASKQKRCTRELVTAGPNPFAVPGAHKFETRRPRRCYDGSRKDHATIAHEA